MKPESSSIYHKGYETHAIKDRDIVSKLLEELSEEKPQELVEEDYNNDIYLRGKLRNPYSPSLGSSIDFQDGSNTLNLELDYEIIEVNDEGKREIITQEKCYYKASVWRAFNLDELAVDGRFVDENNSNNSKM